MYILYSLILDNYSLGRLGKSHVIFKYIMTITNGHLNNIRTREFVLKVVYGGRQRG